ncbi:MAG TPA: class I SAM-dependent methyltransferase [Gaiellaceae bacterium]|nr:class I SAM-dependent methyltransferase [Gaiellaceae bacterium]
MTDVWSARAEAYRQSPAHAAGADLDLVVEWAEPGRGVTALDVATGGGHVAKRLREAGATVVTADRAPGMEPDVVCPAEDIPFADDSFDVVTVRIAPHHFDDVASAVREMARVSRDRVVIEDTLYESEELERIYALRDPTHVRCYTEAEWRGFVEQAGLRVEAVEMIETRRPLEAWLECVDVPAGEADQLRDLLADRLDELGEWGDLKIVIKARKR